MALEIERKFLVQSPPFEEWGEGLRIVQGYLSKERHATVRVRVLGDQGILTVKGETRGVSRLEFEYSIPLDEAEELLKLCAGGLIEKRRWRVTEGDTVWEVDRFEGANEGLWIAEVELETEDSRYQKPSWIGEEVSHHPQYFNSALARSPYKSWSDG